MEDGFNSTKRTKFDEHLNRIGNIPVTNVIPSIRETILEIAPAANTALAVNKEKKNYRNRPKMQPIAKKI